MAVLVAIPIAIVIGVWAWRPTDFVKWIKWIVSYLFVQAIRLCTKRRFDFYDLNAPGNAEKNNFIVPKGEYVLESPIQDGELTDKNDDVLFWGVNSKQERLELIIRRRDGDIADVSLTLRLATGKTYRMEEIGGQPASKGKIYSCGNLQVYSTSPMRRWRLFYNGYLKEIDEETHEEKSIYVKFSLIWRPSSDVFDFSTDVSPSMAAKVLAELPWESSRPPLDRMQKAVNFYAQIGSTHGTVQIGEEAHEQEIYLFGQRMKYFDDRSGLKDVQLSHFIGYIPQNGCCVNLAVVTVGLSQRLCFGFLMEPDTTIRPITSCKNISYFTLDSQNRFQAHITARINYTINGVIEDDETGRALTRNVQFSLNEKTGKGLLFQRIGSAVMEINQTDGLYYEIPTLPKNIPLSVSLTDRVCEIPEVSGGKGSSLSKLTHFCGKLKSFIVPSGIVVTTAAYEEFTTNEILKRIKLLENVMYENVPGDVKETCNMVTDEIVETELPKIIAEEIVCKMEKVFGQKFYLKKFAVRSSATGEDTEQMSAAGQMETFLGITGKDEILLAVKKCWASQFGHIAVQYKRRYGQSINSPMGVVVQEMISCDRAGVLFTCDPLTGNPTRLIITANYGLGESVVSGSEEPDTIILHRDFKDNLSVESISIGDKTHRFVIAKNQGTSLEDVPVQERSRCCLSGNEALLLGKLALQIEKLYRSSRDIEWGFCENNLYIFQSRPVTSGSQESDFEIDHEFDGSLWVENEFFSISNLGEVMPGAITPLGLQILFKGFFIGLQRKNPAPYEIPVARYFQQFSMSFANHAMFNVVNTLKYPDEHKIDTLVQGVMIGLFGRILEDSSLFAAMKERYHDKNVTPSVFALIKTMLCSGRRLEKNLELYSGYRVPVQKYKTSKELFNALLNCCTDYHELIRGQMSLVQNSSLWNLMLMTILAKSHGGFDNAVYNDFANLMTTIDGLESADVPLAMQSLAYHISKAIDPEEFKKKDSQGALEWLKTTTSAAGEKFKRFLQKHGHRCLRELEVRSTPWGDNPEPLVKLLQNMVGNVSNDVGNRSESSISDMLPNLNVPLGLFSRMAVRFLLPFCKRAVQARETAKSLLIKCVDAWRKAYVQLSQLMVAEGRLPDADLLFFLTLEEIQELLETRPPAVVARAFHRRKRYPVIDQYMFPEIMHGLPVKINLEESPKASADGNLLMTGIPVSQGTAKGYIRVALSLNEAASLKPGEILLTHGTDIGWTPYFPTLAGVVTELGGLISHGAVVSREYGIPCIAGLHGATRMFQTGDYVLLDGNNGVLQKLISPDQDKQ